MVLVNTEEAARADLEGGDDMLEFIVKLKCEDWVKADNGNVCYY